MEEDNEEVNSVMLQPVTNSDPTCQPKSIVLANIEDLGSEAISTEQVSEVEQMEQHVLGYLELPHPSGNVDQDTTLYAPELEFGAQRLILTHREVEGDDIYVVVNPANPDQTVAHLPESALLNSNMVTSGNEDKSESFSNAAGNSLANSSGSVGCIQVVNASGQTFNHTVLIEGDQLVGFKNNSADFGSQSSVWSIDDCKEKEEQELIFIPDPSALTSNPEIATSLFHGHTEKTANGNLMELARIAQEFQHASGSEVPVQTEQEGSDGPAPTKSYLKVQQDQHVYVARLQTADSCGDTNGNNASHLKSDGEHPERSNHNFMDNLSSSVCKEVNVPGCPVGVDASMLKEPDVSGASTYENYNTDEVSSQFSTPAQNVGKFVSSDRGDKEHDEIYEKLHMYEKLKSASLRNNQSSSSVSNINIKETELKEDLRIINEVENGVKHSMNEKCTKKKKKESPSSSATKQPTAELTANENSANEKSDFDGEDSCPQASQGTKRFEPYRNTYSRGKLNKKAKKRPYIADKQSSKTLNENKRNSFSIDSTVEAEDNFHSGKDSSSEEFSNASCPAETSDVIRTTSMNSKDKLPAMESPEVHFVNGNNLMEEKAANSQNSEQQTSQEVANVHADEGTSDLRNKTLLDSADTLIEPVMQPPKKTYTRMRMLKNAAKLNNTNLHYEANSFHAAEASDIARNSTDSPESLGLASQPDELTYSPSHVGQEDSPSKKRKLTTIESGNDSSKLQDTTSSSRFTKRKRMSGKQASVADPPPDTNGIHAQPDNKDSPAVSKNKDSKLSRSNQGGRKKITERKAVVRKGRISKSVPPSTKARKLQNSLKNTLKTGQYDPSSEYNFTDSEEPQELNHYPFSGYSSPSRKQRGRPLGSRNRIVNNAETWNKLVNSNPTKIKNTRYLTKLKRRQARSNSHVSPKREIPSAPNLFDIPTEVLALMRAEKKELQVHYIEQPPNRNSFTPIPYCCMICHYETERLQNLISHILECLKTNKKCNYNDVSDMDRRQRIRGELQNDQASPSSSSLESSPSSSSFPIRLGSDQSFSRENADAAPSGTFISVLRTDKECEYSVEDIVWVERKQGFWPAWVKELHSEDRMATIFFIDLPNRRNNSQRVDLKGLLTFHDSDLNEKILSKAKSMPNEEIFIKAVQKAEEFMRKKKCLGDAINAAEFFKSKSNGEPNENNGDSHSPETSEKEAMIKFAKEVAQHIVRGRLDVYALDIFENKIPSERHRKFFSHDVIVKKALMEQSWFGPIEGAETSDIYNYLHELFHEKSEDKSFLIRYTYYVLCPEVIVKAISELKCISIDEAQDLFTDDKFKEAIKEYCP